MSQRSNIGWIVLGMALVASLWASEARAAKGVFEQALSVDGPILLDISTGSGRIDIRQGATDEVQITGHVRVGNGLFRRSDQKAQEMIDEIIANPPIELVGDELRVGKFKERKFRRNVSVSYDIVVPASTRVKSSTGSGSQSITGIAEIVKSSSGSGSLKISDIDGPAVASTGSGRITLTEINGFVDAGTGSGGIKAEGVAGAFEGSSGSGRIILTQTAPGDVKVSTGSGGIEIYGMDGALHARAGSGGIKVQGRQNGTWDLDTGSGSVKLDLPDDAAFQLDAYTGSGGLFVDYPVTVQGKISKRHIRGPVAGGGDLLKVETGSGGIRIE